MRNCTLCQNKTCRSGQDCARQDPAPLLKRYREPENLKLAHDASKLIDNGRAGTLSRVEELLELIQIHGYQKTGIAYCYGLEKEAALFSALFKQAHIRHTAVCCTAGAVLEKEIDPAKTKNTVSCNPLGQGEWLKKAGVDLIVELGLCLGHDILFHRAVLGIDLTVLAVKDRKFAHCPLKGLESAEKIKDHPQN